MYKLGDQTDAQQQVTRSTKPVEIRQQEQPKKGDSMLAVLLPNLSKRIMPMLAGNLHRKDPLIPKWKRCRVPSGQFKDCAYQDHSKTDAAQSDNTA